jgi:hypothetical protein
MGTSPVPRLDPDEYHKELASAVLNTDPWPKGFNSIADNPDTQIDERRTFCNQFVRYVARDLFGYAEWKPWDDGFGERAADLIRTMFESPRWRKLALPSGRNAYDEATLLGSQGHLIVAGALYQAPPGKDRWAASGHVCVVSPVVSMHYSGSWRCKVPMVANAGGRNFMDEGMSKAFKDEPLGLWTYLG